MSVSPSWARPGKQGYERLAELGAPWPTQVITTGGGAANPGWQTIREQLLGIPVSRAEHTEAAYGCALLARQGVATKDINRSDSKNGQFI